MEKEPDYLLVRDIHSSIPFLWKDGLGYLLHPSVPVAEANCRIADLGTRTGIWLLDLARQVPDTTQLYGFDISDSQYPHAKYLPHNVRLKVLDNLDLEPPKVLQETFDIVHLRLWLDGMPNGDPTALLSHAIKLLRPGGYIQWAEMDPLRGITHGPDGEDWPNVANNIEEAFSFEQPWQSKMTSDLSCAVVHEMENNGSPYIAQKLKIHDVSIPPAYAEVFKGARLVQPFCITIGKKPIQNSPFE
ncbi:UMTA methyltransferase family protein-like protein [Mollisia scopiformis]|uniref:UMTA methyltransferase family protein-like protein n=1 Tax=Mollisia scopiformis TaxID=149040 RepID=A0A194XPL2_MOLSC|nr:UMTA methyltransferase family protein-like protein [Mollisia scopiformis]KUJ22190.1 UMTA methyltransferase family protein-like protein [Mollisia scopiformis]